MIWTKRWITAACVLLVGWDTVAQKTEAESGTRVGTQVESSRAGFSGTGYVTGFDQDNDAVTMRISVAQKGLYNLVVGYAAPGGEKINDVYVNGVFAGGQTYTSSQSFREGVFGKVNLNAGENQIKIVKNWGYFDVDYVRVEPAQRNPIHQYSEELVNSAATSEAQVVYRFLRDYYGHRIISGQQAGSGGATEINYLQQHTGKRPAIKGFDLMDYTPSRVERGTTSQETDRAIEWWQQQKGLVTLAWHWNAPKDLLDTQENPWWSGFYTRATTFDVRKAMNDQTSEEYTLLIRDIDVIAVQLKRLSDAKVPVLWRPLHEAEGRWFWWGAKGPEPCVWLWKVLYERLTSHHNLHNLIWVWTGTNTAHALDWYPGDEYVDIIGADIYLNDKNYSASFSMFDDIAGIHGGAKVITLSETGTIPDPDALAEERARWSWFCTWAGDFVLDGVKNERAHLHKVYNHEYVITLDELPDFANYVSPDFPDDEEEEVVLSTTSVSTLTQVYPNPATDWIAVKLTNPDQVIRLELYDLEGKPVLSPQVVIEASLQLNLDPLPQGIYLLRVVRTSAVETIRVIKAE